MLRNVALLALLGLAAIGLSGCAGKERPKADLAASQVTTIGVNSYLWRASLDALSFMPLLQADSSGGVIITDWYANPSNPGERMKVTVSILDRDLRADGVRAAVFRQVQNGANWQDAAVDPRTGTDLEDAILTRARQMRIAAQTRK